MDSRESIEAKGIVLSDYKYRETSRIINIYTENLGKINLFVTGAFGSRSSRAAATQSMALSQFRLYIKNNNYRLTDVSLIDTNMDIAKKPQNFLITSIIMEVVDKSSVENYSDERIYQILLKTLDHMKTTSNPVTLKLAFLIKYLSFIGYKPDLKNVSEIGDYYFSYNRGKIIRSPQLYDDEDYIKINSKEIAILNKLLYSTLEEIEAQEISDKVIKKLDHLLMNFFMYCTGITKINGQTIYNNLYT